VDTLLGIQNVCTMISGMEVTGPYCCTGTKALPGCWAGHRPGSCCGTHLGWWCLDSSVILRASRCNEVLGCHWMADLHGTVFLSFIKRGRLRTMVGLESWGPINPGLLNTFKHSLSEDILPKEMVPTAYI
jgi:hypothetical protein